MPDTGDVHELPETRRMELSPTAAAAFTAALDAPAEVNERLRAVLARPAAFLERLTSPRNARPNLHELKSILRFVDKSPAPALLPILRSQQQAELLALLLGDPELELSLTDLAARTGVPHPSVYREVERAEAAGLVTSRRIGRTRLVRADTASPYHAGLADVLTRAFGVPAVLTAALVPVEGIEEAYIFGSWAARHAGERGVRPVGDIDLLVLGGPDRSALYEAIGSVEQRLGREVQVTVREPGWLKKGSGSFHDTVVGRPILRLDLATDVPADDR